MMWEIVETDKRGNERILKTVSSKPTAERAAMLRRNALSMRGRLNDYDVTIRKVQKEEKT